MRLYASPKLAGLGVGNVSFAAGIRDRLPEQVDPAAGGEKVGDRLTDGGEWKPFVNGHVFRRKIVAMHDHAFGFLPPQACGFGYCEMNRLRTGIGNPIHGEGRRMRNCDGAGSAVRLCPKHGFAVLGERARRKVRNPVDASCDPFDSFSPDEPRQDRIRETCRASLLGGDQSIILFGESDKFVKT